MAHAKTLSISDDQDDQYITTYVKEIVMKRLTSSCGVILQEQTAERSCIATEAVRTPAVATAVAATDASDTAVVPLCDQTGDNGHEQQPVVMAARADNQVQAMVPLMSEEERNTAMGQVQWLEEFRDCALTAFRKQQQAQQIEMDLLRKGEKEGAEKMELLRGQRVREELERAQKFKLLEGQLDAEKQEKALKRQNAREQLEQKLEAEKQEEVLRLELERQHETLKLQRKFPNVHRHVLRDIEASGLRDQAALSRLTEHYPWLMSRSRVTNPMLAELHHAIEVLHERGILCASRCPVVSTAQVARRGFKRALSPSCNEPRDAALTLQMHEHYKQAIRGMGTPLIGLFSVAHACMLLSVPTHEVTRLLYACITQFHPQTLTLGGRPCDAYGNILSAANAVAQARDLSEIPDNSHDTLAVWASMEQLSGHVPTGSSLNVKLHQHLKRVVHVQHRTVYALRYLRLVIQTRTYRSVFSHMPLEALLRSNVDTLRCMAQGTQWPQGSTVVHVRIEELTGLSDVHMAFTDTVNVQPVECHRWETYLWLNGVPNRPHTPWALGTAVNPRVPLAVLSVAKLLGIYPMTAMPNVCAQYVGNGWWAAEACDSNRHTLLSPRAPSLATASDIYVAATEGGANSVLPVGFCNLPSHCKQLLHTLLGDCVDADWDTVQQRVDSAMTSANVALRLNLRFFDMAPGEWRQEQAFSILTTEAMLQSLLVELSG